MRLILSLILPFLFAGATVFGQYHVIGYYPMYAKASLPPAALKVQHLTIINHAFAWPLMDGTIQSYDAVLDTALIHTVHRAGRKILLSLGGAAESGAFPTIAADTSLRRTFIRNLITHLRESGYDGADLDWEGPATNADKTNEVALVREMRQAMQAADTSWLFTMAVGVNDWSGRWHQFDSLKLYLDWFNAMTYVFHGSWSNHAGHNSPLYPPPQDNDGSCDDGIRYLNGTRGIPLRQLVLGLPFFGIQFLSSTMYAPSSGYVGEVGYSTVVYNVAHGWPYHWDAIPQVPYLTSPSKTKVISFDDSLSLTRKCFYARNRGLPGVMIWALGQDVLPGGAQPLMDAVGLAMSPTTDIPSVFEALTPQSPLLINSYPNPFNASTIISFRISTACDVHVSVYDLLGREVALLAYGRLQAGEHRVRFDGAGLASGMYICRLAGNGAAVSTKLLLLR